MTLRTRILFFFTYNSSMGTRVGAFGAKIEGSGAKIGDSGVKIVAFVRPTQFFLSYFDPWGLLWSPLRGP